MDLSFSGKVGLRAVVYYMTTTVLAVTLGVILVMSIKPGAGGKEEEDLQHEDTEMNVTTADTLMDVVRWAENHQIVGKFHLIYSDIASRPTLSKLLSNSTKQSWSIRVKQRYKVAV